jgi:Domain of unknown function (DUF4815)
MPIEKDLSVAPYFDEAAAGLEKNYYKILFKPSVPVQVRELNELQTILQNQIEEFGDNIIKKGSIIRGCSFTFYNSYPYIKIKDSLSDGAPVNLSALKGKTLNSNGHTALIIDYVEGFESTAPDTKTLYLKYTNSGNEGGNTVYVADDIIKVQDLNLGVSNVVISVSGTGYSNADTVVFVSAVAVQNVTGTIVVGSTLTQNSTGANVVVVSVDTTSYPDKTVLVVRPTTGDLANTSKASDAWTLSLGADNPIKSSSNSAVTAIPIETIGLGAAAIVTTDAAARVVDVSMTSAGSGYYVAPYVTVRSVAGSAATLTAQNYVGQVIVYNGANSVGTGYAFGVSDGVIYQKGYFLKVPDQTVIVSKYNTYPNSVSVGFLTAEDIVDAYEDTSLLDNSLGTRNYTAPGADRLQLTPTLTVLDSETAAANLEFLPIVEFASGVPYKQRQTTVYNTINDEMALRTSDSSGDFVTDQFLVATKSNANVSLSSNTFNIVVDPGTAYVEGYRVKTYGNYEVTVDKGIETATKSDAIASLNYGNFVVVDNLAGSFDFSAGKKVRLYDEPCNYLSNSSIYETGTIPGAGSRPGKQIGTARIRSLIYVGGLGGAIPGGTDKSRYRLYLFDIRMNPGQSFKNIRAIYNVESNYPGVADVVLSPINSSGISSDGSAANSTNQIKGAVLRRTTASDKTSLDKLIFHSGFDSPLSINNIRYYYREFNDSGTTYTLSNTGLITITLAGDEYFPYNTDLSDPQKQELLFTPLTDAYASVGSGSTANVASANSIVASTNATFIGSLEIGDYINITGNTAENVIRRVISIGGTTQVTLDATPGFTNSTSTLTRMFPANIPLPITTRENMTANVTTNSRTLTVDIGTELATNNPIPLIGAFNIYVSNSSITTKTPNRDLFVKICPANNTTGFGYSEYGSGVDGYFTEGSNAVSNTVTGSFSAGQKIVVSRRYRNFVATVNTITNSTHMTLTTPVNIISGNADIYPALNSNGPWCLGVADIFRLKAVYIANTVNVNTNSTEVTRDFFIDHNHNPNFADLGYLVKTKKSSLVIKPSDFLLVQFDAFTRNEEGRPVLVNSYVDSNLNNRANTDSLRLNQLNNTLVNTFEIPEIHGPGGDDYDMISYIDFRPSLANTAALTNSSSSATLNPDYAVNFTAAAKKFPVPDTNMSFDCTYFMGRVDTVYIGASGKIGVARGKPVETDLFNSVDPRGIAGTVQKKGVMILNYVKIPAYPSVEDEVAFRINNIIDTRVINEIRLNRRKKKHAITLALDPQEIQLEQPRRYTMEDIGSLERRIKNLEYYVSLSNLELAMKDLNLPSSIANHINRFKYGFSADSFDDYKYADVDSLEYSATIASGRLLPPTEEINLEIPQGSSDFTNYLVVSQNKATKGGAGADTPSCVGEAHWQYNREAGAENTENEVTHEFTMASELGNESGKVVAYFFMGAGPNRVRIWQSVDDKFSGDEIKTAADAKPLTERDVKYLSSLNSKVWRSDEGFQARGLKHEIVAGNPVRLRYGGKIVFNHNPANGSNYKISVYGTRFIARIEFPINVECGSGGGEDKPNKPDKYDGTLTMKNFPDIVTGSLWGKPPTGSKPDAALAKYTTKYYKLHLKATGLKPSTKHKVFFAGKDMSHLCDTSVQSTEIPTPPVFSITSNQTWAQYNSQIPDVFNDSPNGYIMTDASGKVEFFLYVLQDQQFNSNFAPGWLGVPNENFPETLYDVVGEKGGAVVKVVNDAGNSKATERVQSGKNKETFSLFSGFKSKTNK